MSYLTPIYDVWDGNAEAMAHDIGESGVTVRQWRNRSSIPPNYWQRIIHAAAKKGRPLKWGDFVNPDEVHDERGRELKALGHLLTITQDKGAPALNDILRELGRATDRAA